MTTYHVTLLGEVTASVSVTLGRAPTRRDELLDVVVERALTTIPADLCHRCAGARDRTWSRAVDDLEPIEVTTGAGVMIWRSNDHVITGARR